MFYTSSITILVLYTACFYHFLFWGYLNSGMTGFSSDVLLRFPNLNNLNSCEGRYLQHKLYLSNCKMKAKKELQRKKLMKNAENDVEDLKNDENSVKNNENSVSDKDEDLDNCSETVCSICNCLWRGYMKKGNWLICDICKKYICLLCMPKSTNPKQDFSCKIRTQ